MLIGQLSSALISHASCLPPKALVLMRNNYLVFGQPLIEEAEIEEVVKSLRAAWLGTGPKVAAFEKLIGEYKGVKHAVAVNSCTACI